MHNQRRPTSGRPLKIGYASPDFRAHVVSHFIEPVLRHHDPHAVETVLYAEVAVADSSKIQLLMLRTSRSTMCRAILSAGSS